MRQRELVTRRKNHSHHQLRVQGQAENGAISNLPLYEMKTSANWQLTAKNETLLKKTTGQDNRTDSRHYTIFFPDYLFLLLFFFYYFLVFVLTLCFYTLIPRYSAWHGHYLIFGLWSCDVKVTYKEIRLIVLPELQNTMSSKCQFDLSFKHDRLILIKLQSLQNSIGPVMLKKKNFHLARKYSLILLPDIICSEKPTVFRERRSRKTVSYAEQIMYKDK